VISGGPFFLFHAKGDFLVNKILEPYTNFCTDRRKDAVKFLSLTVAGLAAFYLLFTIFPVLFRAQLLIIPVLFTAALVLLYSGFVSGMEESDEERKRCRVWMKTGMILVCVFIISVPIRRLVYTTKSSALAGVWFMAAVMTLILSTALFASNATDKMFVALDKGFLNAITQTKVVEPGDLILCNIKEEVEAGAADPREILPAKDRFLHMLILGPTGCGKTSQSLIPMVLQDVQNPEWGITVLEPKGDFAIKAFMMAKEFGREAIYFDPSYKNCAKFNPLAGREIDVVENIATTFKMLNPDSPQFFLDLNEQLVKNAVKVLKRLDASEGVEGKYATLISLNRLLQNTEGKGRDWVHQFGSITSKSDSEAAENRDIASWFLNEYFPERSKVYENTSGVRSQVAKLVSNEYLREVLNPDFSKGESNEIDFDTHLASGTVICISTAQGTLRDLSKYLGYFIILSLQSSVFRRPGNENTRRPHTLYIDEFQTYSTPGFADMLTQGRSYRVSSVLATQARAQMAMGGGKDGKSFVELVSSNARNVILYPGINKDDAKYYSDQFGEYEKVETQVGISRKKFSLLTGGLSPLGHPTESIREQRKMTANYSTTDLIYGQNQGKSFGEITYTIIKNNSLQPAKVGLITYIPKDLNDKLDKKILAYTEEFARESAVEAAAHKRAEAQEEKERPLGILKPGNPVSASPSAEQKKTAPNADPDMSEPVAGTKAANPGITDFGSTIGLESPLDPLDMGQEEILPVPPVPSGPIPISADDPSDWDDDPTGEIPVASPETNLHGETEREETDEDYSEDALLG